MKPHTKKDILKPIFRIRYGTERTTLVLKLPRQPMIVTWLPTELVQRINTVYPHLSLPLDYVSYINEAANYWHLQHYIAKHAKQREIAKIQQYRCNKMRIKALDYIAIQNNNGNNGSDNNE